MADLAGIWDHTSAEKKRIHLHIYNNFHIIGIPDIFFILHHLHKGSYLYFSGEIFLKNLQQVFPVVLVEQRVRLPVH